MNKEISEKIQELQSIEQNLQMFIQQKQAMQIDFNETSNALSEVEKSKGSDIFKIISGIMIKSDKDSLISELNEKQNLLNARIQAIEKQESLIEKKSLELREEITKEISKNSEDKRKKGDKRED